MHVQNISVAWRSRAEEKLNGQFKVVSVGVSACAVLAVHHAVAGVVIICGFRGAEPVDGLLLGVDKELQGSSTRDGWDLREAGLVHRAENG